MLQKLQELEEEMLQEEIQPSVYFTEEDSELLQIYDHIKKATTSDQAGSAVEGGVFFMFKLVANDLALGHSRKHPHLPTEEINLPTPFGPPKSFTIILSEVDFAPCPHTPVGY
jgi:hypothetical protein